MNPKIIKEQLDQVIKNNGQLTDLQKKALKEAKKCCKAGMNEMDILKLIEILGTLLMISHNT